MNFNKNINTFEEFSTHIAKINSELEQLIRDLVGSRFSKLNAKDTTILDLVVKIAQKNDQLKNSKFKILILGEFKKGKSTFINALLGDEILPSYSMPCTDVINEVTWGEETKIIIKKSNNQELEVSRDELEKHVTIDGELNTQDNKTILAQIFHPLHYCKNGVIILDTPGLNEDLRRTNTTLGHLSQSDAIIFVIAADQACSMTELETIKNLTEDLGFNDLFFVCNRMGVIQEKEKSSLIKYVIEKLSKQLKQGPAVHFVDSLSALEIKLKGGEVSTEFRNLESSIQDYLIGKRGSIKVRNAIGELNIGIQASLLKLENRKKILSNDIKEVESILSKCSAQLNENADTLTRIERLWSQSKLKIADDLISLFIHEVKSGSVETVFRKHISYICSSGNKALLGNPEYVQDVFNSLREEWIRNCYEFKFRPILEALVSRSFSEIENLSSAHLLKCYGEYSNNLVNSNNKFQFYFNPDLDKISNNSYLIIDCNHEEKKSLKGMSIGAVAMMAIDLAFTGGGTSLLLSAITGVGGGILATQQEKDDTKFIEGVTKAFIQNFISSEKELFIIFKSSITQILDQLGIDYVEAIKSEMRSCGDYIDLLKQDQELEVGEKENIITDINEIINMLDLSLNKTKDYF